MYEQACQLVPKLDWVEASWYCRKCAQSFKTKAGLGAHFFKCHGRKAQFRAFVAGSLCRACGRQYWSQARLAIHLCDNVSCVNTLRKFGLGAATVPAGIGSRAWRKQCDEEFTLAPPVQQQAPLLPWREGQWDDVQLMAHADICSELFRTTSELGVQDVLDILFNVFTAMPLYRNEEKEVVDYLESEVRLLFEDDPTYPWCSGSYANILEAFNEFREMPVLVEDTTAEQASEAVTFQRFSGTESQQLWGKLHIHCLKNSGTQGQPFEILDFQWEAESLKFSDGCTFSAAIQKAFEHVPSVVRELWTDFLDGNVSEVRAPLTFWASPYAAPFRALRAPLQA